MHTETWVGDAKGEVAVIGEHHQAFGVCVETPCRIYPWTIRNQVNDRRPSLRIIRSTHRPDRLVDGVVGQIRSDRQRHAIDLDTGGCRIDLLTEMGGFTIYGDPTVRYENFGVAARDVPGSADQLLESFDDPSGRKGRSSVSTISAGGTWSASGGRSWGLFTPSFSRNSSVVP